MGTSLRDTYKMYPYHESHETRALSSQECPLYTIPRYYDDMHLIPTYNSTCRIVDGMVHAWVAQKLIKRDIFKRFYDVRFINV